MNNVKSYTGDRCNTTHTWLLGVYSSVEDKFTLVQWIWNYSEDIGTRQNVTL